MYVGMYVCVYIYIYIHTLSIVHIMRFRNFVGLWLRSNICGMKSADSKSLLPRRGQELSARGHGNEDVLLPIAKILNILLTGPVSAQNLVDSPSASGYLGHYQLSKNPSFN